MKIHVGIRRKTSVAELVVRLSGKNSYFLLSPLPNSANTPLRSFPIRFFSSLLKIVKQRRIEIIKAFSIPKAQ